jgi:cell division inhibitor SepF
MDEPPASNTEDAMSNPLKKTMVYLGLADEEEVYDEPEPGPAARKNIQPVEKAAAPVTPLHRPAVVRQPAPSAISEILTVHPKQYRDAQIIAENFRDGIPVIINLSQMSDADARRLIDFASGLSLGLYGRNERVTSKVFLLSPESVNVSGDGALAQADAESVPFAQ